LHGVEETCQQAVRQAGALMELREQLHREMRSKPKAAALIDPLFVNPYMTVSRAAELLNVSLPTARQAIQTLEESGILQEVTGRAWGKTYVESKILSLIENTI
jgi:Fic family protein